LSIIDFHPQKRAKVHFIPDLKVGVSVTLRAPDVMMVTAFAFNLYQLCTLKKAGVI
jgi:hypothetical protein